MSGERVVSLRRRFLTVTVGGAVLAFVVALVFVVINQDLRHELQAAMTARVEEQRIADQVVGGVMRQLVTVSSVALLADSTFRGEFDAAGAVVYEGLRTYLFRALDADERLQIERVKEHHEQLEVSAVRAAELARLRDPAAAEAALHDVMNYGRELLATLEGFLRLREEGLQRLGARQEATLGRLQIAALAALILFVVIFPTILARFLRRRVALPLEEMASAADRLGHGDLATRVPERQDRELRRLAVSFNQMAARLAASQAEVVQAEKLGAVGRMTAGIAHELNNPLASVLGFSELLLADLEAGTPMTPDQLRGYMDPIVREATRARLLIRGLLQFSRRASSDVHPVPLVEVCRLVCDLRAHAFRQDQVRLEVGDLPDIAVLAEAQQLQNAFLNILNNALDALRSRPGGIVRVCARATGDWVVITIEDNGPGLAEPERVFEPFYTTKDVGEGTGLGLSITRRAIESFGGAVRAENVPGSGARFTIELLTAPRASAEPAPAPVPDRAPTAPFTGRTVLVVEDEPHLQQLSRRILQRLGVAVLVASSAQEARTLLARNDVHLIVSDVRMPEEDGVALYRWVQEHYPALSCRFLFATGDIHAPELASFAEEQPGRLILKPFELDDYLARVGDALAGAA